MGRLPPTDKLPLALRKNIRDNWESTKEGLETKLSAVLGTAWTVDINPNALHPYANSDYAMENLGGLINEYVSQAIYKLEYFKERNGADGIAELNGVATKHVLTMDLDEANTTAYNGVEIKNGELVILFNEKNLGTNIDQALELERLVKAINEAPPAEGAAPQLSFAVRTGIAKRYDERIGELKAKIDALLGVDVTLVPNFEAAAGQLGEAAKTGQNGNLQTWEQDLGSVVYEYFDGVRFQLDTLKFGSDDLLQEGFNEAVDKHTIEFRIVDKLVKGTYNEVVVEDGKLYVQTTVKQYRVNTDQAAEKIVDLL